MCVFPEGNDPKSVTILRKAVRECIYGGTIHLVASLCQFVLDVQQRFAFIVGGKGRGVFYKGNKWLDGNDSVNRFGVGVCAWVKQALFCLLSTMVGKVAQQNRR